MTDSIPDEVLALARAIFIGGNAGASRLWEAMSERNRKFWFSEARDAHAALAANGYVITKRIPHEGKVNADDRPLHTKASRG